MEGVSVLDIKRKEIFEEDFTKTMMDYLMFKEEINVKEYKQEFLYNKIGYVPQKAVIFNGTVSSNVRYGNR